MIAVDDERLMLRQLEKAILRAAPQAKVNSFLSPFEALEFAENISIDVAFLDIRMGGMSGLELAKKLKEIQGDINIVFVTGYDEYATEAFSLHASGYLLKPADPDKVKEELEHLRAIPPRLNEGIYVQCFGNFEIFHDGKPLVFSRAKSKELFAYLVDRNGAGVSKKEFASILWEDKPYSRSIQSHLHILIAEMINTFAVLGVEDVVIKQRNLYSVDTSKIACDYYDFLKGKASAVNAFRGEYMSNYTWAEFTTGNLSRKIL